MAEMTKDESAMVAEMTKDPLAAMVASAFVKHPMFADLVDRLGGSTEAEPAMRRIETWNAASNRYMIAVNEELGYEVWGQPYRSAELPVSSVRQS